MHDNPGSRLPRLISLRLPPSQFCKNLLSRWSSWTYARRLETIRITFFASEYDSFKRHDESELLPRRRCVTVIVG